MGELRTLGKEGDVKAIWDPTKKKEVAMARKTFDDLKKDGYYAYSVGRDGEKGEVLQEFDPQAGKIIMALPMRGG